MIQQAQISRYVSCLAGKNKLCFVPGRPRLPQSDTRNAQLQHCKACTDSAQKAA